MATTLRGIGTRSEFKRLWEQSEHLEIKTGLLHALRAWEYPERKGIPGSLLDSIDDAIAITHELRESSRELFVTALSIVVEKSSRLPNWSSYIRDRGAIPEQIKRIQWVLQLLAEAGQALRREPHARQVTALLGDWHKRLTDQPYRDYIVHLSDNWYDAVIACGAAESFETWAPNDRRVVDRITAWLQSHLGPERKFRHDIAFGPKNYEGLLLKILMAQLVRCGEKDKLHQWLQEAVD